MSLESTRGRFSKKKISRDDFYKIKNKSEISKFAKKPLEKILSKVNNLSENKTDNNTLFKNKNNIVNAKTNSHNEQYEKTLSKRETYNKNIEKKYEFEEEYDFTEHKKKIDVKLIAAMAIFELLTIVVILAVGRVVRLSRMTEQVKFRKNEVKNTNIDSVTIEKMKGYLTVALFGLDNRNGSVGSGNADVNKIVHLNFETGELKIISVYRDLFLSITNGNTYGKLNAAYSRGGPENSVKVLNKNLDLDISNYFSFNWKAVAEAIDLLGGVDVEITKQEMKYFNAFIHETCISTGIESKNPSACYVKQSGMQHLIGVQAVAYARLRLTDNDIKRTERQNTIMSLCLEKAKQLDPAKLVTIAEYILPQISYEFDMSNLMSLASTVKGISLSESYGFPTTQNLKMMNMGSNGSCIVPNSLESAVKKLHQFMYGDENYTVTNAVKSYSNRILELSREYEKENMKQIEEKQKELESENSEESQSTSNKTTTSNKKKATKSQATQNNNNSNTNNSESSNESKSTDKPVVLDNAPYEEEQEEEVVVIDNNPPTNQTTKATTENRVPKISDGPIASPEITPDISIQNNIPPVVSPISPVNNSGPIVSEDPIIVSGPGG